MRFLNLLFLFNFVASAQSTDPCLQTLGDLFPRAWRIDQKKVERFLAENPEQNDLFQKYVQLAHFIDAPENYALFDWLGTQYYLSVANRLAADSKVAADRYVEAAAQQLKLTNQEIDRIKEFSESQILLDIKAMEDQGLYGVRFFLEGAGARALKTFGLEPEHFKLQSLIPKSALRIYLTVQQLFYSTDPLIHASMASLDGLYELYFSLLDPIDFEQSKSVPQGSTEYDLKKINKLKIFMKFRGFDVPTFLKYTLHSAAARNYAVVLILGKLGEILTYAELTEFLELYKKSMFGQDVEMPAKYQKINKLLIQEYAQPGSLIQSFSAASTPPKKIKELQQNFLIDMINFIHANRLNSLVRVDDAKTTSAILFYLIAFSHRTDVSIDQGLEPLIYKSFVSMVLNKRMLTGDEYRSMLRSRLKNKISLALQTVSKNEPKIILPMSNREPIAPTKLMTRTERQALYRRSEPEGESSTSQDRNIEVGTIEGPIEPDTPVNIVIKPSGITFQVSFSASVVAQLSKPWLEALARGPSDPNSGWRQVRDHEWRITIPGSHQRLVGYRDHNGLWYFTHFI